MSKSNLMHTGSGHMPVHSVNTGTARRPVHPLPVGSGHGTATRPGHLLNAAAAQEPFWPKTETGQRLKQQSGTDTGQSPMRPSGTDTGQRLTQQSGTETGQSPAQPPGTDAGQSPAQPSRKVTAQKPSRAPQEMASEKIIRKQHEFEMWRIQETERLESKKQNLRRQTRQIEEERIRLNIEKAHFHRQQEFEETKKKHEEHVLEMKRQILEGELYKLAEEKKQFEQKKNFYDQVDAYQKDKGDIRTKPSSVHGELFFAGVTNQSSLKKRYKDLLKIYHPDNKCGDTDAIQEINHEYQRLLAKLQEKGSS